MTIRLEFLGLSSLVELPSEVVQRGIYKVALPHSQTELIFKRRGFGNSIPIFHLDRHQGRQIIQALERNIYVENTQD